MFKSFDEIISEVKKNQKKQKVAVVGADKDVAIEAAADIVADNLGEPVLFGPKEKIEKLWKGTVLENKVEVVDCFDAEMCCTRAVDYAVEGKVHL
ncbi:MAG TPA: phosphate acyltransferase, partial [bacterium]|nr:phosphate acyltransferase [bacterium]